ncbi:hypothetical protein SPAN111604_14965 [Sphingomonas antarctica]|uniref:SGNH/GDSL hydrolase family protein n=1 Tax=Sphingomonas antarctica TaxID=2040274 RepID=UPI0039E7BEDD
MLGLRDNLAIKTRCPSRLSIHCHLDLSKLRSAIRDPRSAIRDPRSAIRDPRSAIGVLSLLALAACSGSRDNYASHREKAILSHAAQDRFPIVMVGDSFVELMDLPILCGKRVLNAGVSGAKVADTAQFAPKVIASERPKLLIVNVGVNDAHRKVMTRAADVRRDLTSILDVARKAGVRVLLLGIAPITGKGISAEFNADKAIELNAALIMLGGKPVPALDSDDGLHPNAKGYVKLKSIISGVCNS